MYKFFLTLLFFLFVFSSAVHAKLIDGVAIVVKGSAITLYDIEKEMKLAKVDAKSASDILIRKKLEELETKERKISVTSSEVYEDIKKTAAANKMSVDEFYAAVRESNGLTSTELKKTIKQRLLAQKLYAAIAYSKLSQPSDQEVKEYYELHKKEFMHPSVFNVIVNFSSNKEALEAKMKNPMLYAPQVQTKEESIPYEKVSPELASLLANTPLNSFTPVVPNGQGAFMSFYVKGVEDLKEIPLESVQEQIKNKIMAKQREEVLGDYFARLRHNADITIIRMPQ